MKKYFSTFSGIGGAELAIREIFPEAECVGYSEIHPRAVEIYQKHFPEHKNYGDITQIDADALPDFDFFVGGFPCQAFSIAGNRGGFNDTRGTLFFDIARILKAKQPECALLENVKGLLSHDGGKTFETVLSTLDELGYDAEWCVLDSINYGAAPRPRVYVLAMHRVKNASVRERSIEALSLYSAFRAGLRFKDDTARVEEVRRGSERTLRAFAKLPDWLDSWDSFYPKESTTGQRNDSEYAESNPN